MIEAVFEDPALKAKVFAEIQDVVNPDALLCSNTSTLPITELAEGVSRPDGLHRPALLLARSTRCRWSRSSGARRPPTRRSPAPSTWSRQIRKTPIVVNDSRGFYTSRVIGTLLNEGPGDARRGRHPLTIERAATMAGYPVGAAADLRRAELELMAKIRKATARPLAGTGASCPTHAADAVIDADDRGRPRRARLRGAGFYDYDEHGSAAAPLDRAAPSTSRPADEQPADVDDLKDRYLFIEALETARCFEEGVIESAAAANIGSIMGIGFPALTGGAVQFMQGYEGPAGRGLTGFVARARELAAAYGERFEPPAYVVDLAEKGERFPA